MPKREFSTRWLTPYWLWLLGLLLIFAFPVAVRGDSYAIHLITITIIYYILAQSLNLLLGYTGFVSLGQVGFFAVGAYVTSLLVLKLGVALWVSMVAAVLCATVLGFLVGLVTLRFRSHVFALVTLAFAELVRLTAYNWKDLTGGPDGIFNIPRPAAMHLGGMVIDYTQITTFYYLIALFFILVTAVSLWLTKSSFGRMLVAIRENETYAEFVGVNTWHCKVGVFTLSAAMAGLSGVLYAHYIGYISPYTFNIGQSVNALLMVILGGGGTIVGPLIGSAFVQIVPELLRGLSDYRMVIYGGVLVLAVLFMPRGITGLRIRLGRKVKKDGPQGVVQGKEQVLNNAENFDG